MSSESEHALYDIRDAVLETRRHPEGLTDEQSCRDDKTSDAASRRLEIMSEASRRLDDPVRDRHPDLPWREIRDAGNFDRHDDDNVAQAHVWSTIIKRLEPSLVAVDAQILLASRWKGSPKHQCGRRRRPRVETCRGATTRRQTRTFA